MFAIVEIGGQQFKVAKGDKIIVKKLQEEEGKKVVFDKVYLLNDGTTTEVGTPLVEATVEAKILVQKRDVKVNVFKMKAKKRYSKSYGHRSYITELEIEDIKKGKAVVKKAAPAPAPTPAPEEVKTEAPKKKAAPKKKPAAKKPTKKKSEES